jgi:cell division protease FtsH
MANTKNSKGFSLNEPGGPAQPQKGGRHILWIYAAILMAIGIFYFITNSGSVKTITWQQFEQTMLKNHDVAKVDIINGEQAEVYIKPEKLKLDQYKDVATTSFKLTNPGPHFQFSIGSSESFDRKLDEAQKNFAEGDKVAVNYIKKSNWFAAILIYGIPLIFIFIFFRMMSKQTSGPGGSSIFNFGKSTATLMDKENRSNITFEDVAGLEDAKVEVQEIIEFLKEPENFTRLGAKIPKGVLLAGPTGTGKTLLVKAMAGEAKVPFLYLSGSEFVEMFVGVGASRVRDLFHKAKQIAPCIVFIDEIDAVGRSRASQVYAGANDERESTLNQLLTEMDGFENNTGIIVVAATNRADILDSALLRPGRFDRHIYLDLPNLNERKAIFKVHLRPLILEPNLDLGFLAAQTPGFSGTDIANLCNEAALIAAREKKSKVDKPDFINAIDRIIAGTEHKNRIISPREKKIIAYHEAGHATISWLLKNVDPLMKVSIIPRGKSLGAAWYLPEERQIRTTAQFTDMLCASLGGRAAEDVTFGEISSGALDDLEKVTREAYTMVAYYGLNKTLGNISYFDSTGRSEGAFQKPFSEETGKLIDEEVRKLVNETYERTKNILVQNKESLKKLAELLLEKEVVFKEDIEKILGKRPEADVEMINKAAETISPAA